ncbi:membrane protein [Actinomycetota bacterium]|nr:membrane protein [Actinomycetota bacterium]
MVATAHVPRWAVVSATLAPVGMIGGWTLAASRQTGFDPVRDTISALATSAATDPAVMTVGFAVTAVAHLVTAAGLRPLPRAGRALLALGGLGTALVAVLPADVHPEAHRLSAAMGFAALAVWPLASGRRGHRGVRGVRVNVVAAGVLLGLLTWFVLELPALGPADRTGLAERAVAGAQSLWPLVVVLALWRGDGSARRSADA